MSINDDYTDRIYGKTTSMAKSHRRFQDYKHISRDEIYAEKPKKRKNGN